MAVVLYVDDLFLRGNNKFLKETVNELTAIYKEVKVTTSKLHSYLGMLFDYRIDGEVKIAMIKYIADVWTCMHIFLAHEIHLVVQICSSLTKVHHCSTKHKLSSFIIRFLAIRTSQPIEQDY